MDPSAVFRSAFAVVALFVGAGLAACGGENGSDAPFSEADARFFCESLSVAMTTPWQFDAFFSRNKARFNAGYDAKARDYIERRIGTRAPVKKPR
jgi:hypothetical protein